MEFEIFEVIYLFYKFKIQLFLTIISTLADPSEMYSSVQNLNETNYSFSSNWIDLYNALYV